MHTLKERTYVNRDSTKVVPEGSTDAAYLLGIAGDEISDETAKRLGLGTAVATSAAYSDMKVPDLRSLALERGLEIEGGVSKANKPELVDALEESDKVAKEATAETDGTASEGAPEETAAAGTPAEA